MSETTETAVSTTEETTTPATKADVAADIIDQLTSPTSWKTKLKSSKFQLALVGVVSGICGMIGFNNNTTAIIVFAAIELISIIGYMVVEGRVNTTRVKEILGAVTTLVDMIDANKEGKKIETIPTDGSAEVKIDDKTLFTDVGLTTSDIKVPSNGTNDQDASKILIGDIPNAPVISDVPINTGSTTAVLGSGISTVTAPTSDATITTTSTNNSI